MSLYNNPSTGFMPGITHPYSRQAIVNVSAKFDMTEINNRLSSGRNSTNVFPLYKNAALQDPNVYYNVDMYTPAFRRLNSDPIRYFDTSSLMYFTHFNKVTFDDEFIKSYYGVKDNEVKDKKDVLMKLFSGENTSEKKLERQSVIRAFEQEFQFVGVTQAEWRPAQHGLTGMEPLSADNTGDFDVAMAVRGTTTMVNNGKKRIHALRPIMWELPGADGEEGSIERMDKPGSGACQKYVNGINPHQIVPIIKEASTDTWENFLEAEATKIADNIDEYDGNYSGAMSPNPLSKNKINATYYIQGLKELADDMIKQITAFCDQGYDPTYSEDETLDKSYGDVYVKSFREKYKNVIKTASRIGIELHDSLSHNIIGISLTDTEPGQQGDFLLE